MTTPSVSTEELRNVADYIIDTSYEPSDITAVFDGLNHGETVHFGPGTHVVESEQRGALVAQADNITVTGVGESTIIESPDQQTSIFDINGHDGWYIRDLRIRETNPENDTDTSRTALYTDIEDSGSLVGKQEVDTFYMDNVWIDGFFNAVAILNIQEHSLINNLRIYDCVREGFQFAAIEDGRVCRNSLVTNSLVKGAGDDGYEITETVFSDDETLCENTGAIGCWAVDCGDHSFEFDDDGLRSYMISCWSINAGRRGVHFDSDAKDCIIDNCYLIDSGEEGINAIGDGLTVTNTEIIGTGDGHRGIRSRSQLLVDNCYFEDTAISAIGVDEETGKDFDTVIRDCEFVDCAGSGGVVIFYQGQGQMTIRGGKFTDSRADAADHPIRYNEGEGGIVRDVERVEGFADQHIRVDVNDVRIFVPGWNWADVDDRADTTVLNGIGHNGSEDPRSAGGWNGNGYEGLVVTWDDGGTERAEGYLERDWMEIGARLILIIMRRFIIDVN